MTSIQAHNKLDLDNPPVYSSYTSSKYVSDSDSSNSGADDEPDEYTSLLAANAGSPIYPPRVQSSLTDRYSGILFRLIGLFRKQALAVVN